MKKYLLVPQNGTFSERELIGFKGKSFYIEEIRKADGIILDKKINTKGYKKENGIPFESCTFKNLRKERVSRQIVLDDSFSPQEKKKLSALFRKDIPFYQYEEHGWEKIGEQRLVFGEFNVTEVPFVELSLFTGTMQAAKHEISKENFLDYRKNGMPSDDYEEMKDDTDFSAPVYSDYSVLKIDDQKVPGFLRFLKKAIDSAVEGLTEKRDAETDRVRLGANYSAEKSAKNKEKTPQPHLFVFNAWTKRAWYSLTIYENFDLKRIKVLVERHLVYPNKDPIYTYELAYEGADGAISAFDFYEDSGTNSDSSFLYDAKGRAFAFEVTEDADVDCDDEDDYDFDDDDE